MKRRARSKNLSLGLLLLVLALSPTIVLNARGWKELSQIMPQVLSSSEQARRRVLARIESGDTSAWSATVP